MNGDNFWTTRELKILLVSALLAVFGGFAKLFISRRQITFYLFISASIVSGFTGVMTSYLLRYMDLPPLLQNFLIGMSGFAAPTTLSAFTRIYAEKLGINPEKNANNSKEGETGR